MDTLINSALGIGKVNIPNRIVFQPMEGCDCNLDGSPSEYTIRKYMKFAEGSAGLIWFEANGVCPDGLTSPRQMRLTAENLDVFKKLVNDVREKAVKQTGVNPQLILQLTHSGERVMSMNLSKAAPSNRAYVNTKRVQMQQRDAEYEAEHGHPRDLDKELALVERSSMPFED